jgi:hypothetical protein
MSDAARQAPVVSANQVVAAGFASAAAAFITSRFGVTGTLIGAALTAMIITGGSAILKAYLEGVTGQVRKMPHKLRAQRGRWKAGRVEEPPTLPERPDLRDNFAGRMRAALDWFSHLPPLTRRSILIKGLITAVAAFVIGMGAVYAVETGIGNSLSCGLWAKCPEGAKPGIHLVGDRDTGANSSLSLGRAKTNAAPGYEVRDPASQQNVLEQQNVVEQNRSYRQEGPGYRQPADPGAERGGGLFEPDRPVEPRAPAQPETPSTASPAPGGQESPPPDASPAPSE